MSRRPLLVFVLSLFCTAPATANPRVVVAFGDSTTAPRGPLTVYAGRLQKELPARGIDARVVNAGRGGNDTGHARARLNRDVLAHRPDVVIIQFGINDASVEVWRTPPATAPRVARKDYEANLRAMVGTLKDRGVTVVLMTPNPMRWTAALRKLYGKPPYRPDAADGFNVLLKDYAAGVRALAREEKVPLVDVYAAFQAHGKVKGQSVDDLLLDGMHPNDKGHRLVADLLLARLPALLKKEPLPRKLLLVGQGPDGLHPAGTHEYLAGLRVLQKCLRGVKGLEVTTVRADGAWKDGPELLERADGVVLFVAEGAKWMSDDPRRREALRRMLARGGGLVVLHWAMGTRDARPIDVCLSLAGGCHGGPDRKYTVIETTAQVADARHPITAGIRDFRVKDEFYYRLKFVKPAGSVRPVLRVRIKGKPETVAWSWERPASGRAFGFSGLHFHANWRLREYRRLVAQGVLWTLKLPVPKEGLTVEVPEADLTLK